MMYSKPTKIRSKKIRDSARGESCTLQTPVCNGDNNTVVLCHAPCENKGIASKSDDFWGAFGCSACHDFQDRNVAVIKERQFYWMRGIYRTQKRLIEKGLIKL